MHDHASKQSSSHRAHRAIDPRASPGKRTLVDSLSPSPVQPRRSGDLGAVAAAPLPRGARLDSLFGRRDGSPPEPERATQACAGCGGAIAGGADCPTCKPPSQPRAPTIAGADPVKATPVTEADRAEDLQSTQLGGDAQLQAAFDDNPPIALGRNGPEVARLQQALIDLGFDLPKSTGGGKAAPDGVFGPETLQQLKGFQTRQGIQVDGVAGRQTLGELDGLMSGRHVPGTPASKAATTVSITEVRPQQFLACGGFDWAIDWNTDGRNGYLVQEIIATAQGTWCDGSDDPDTAPLTPHFWEAWRVQTDGSVHGGSPNDTFSTGRNAAGHTGTWSITGNVHWIEQLPPGFRVSAVPESNLFATTTQPAGLGPVLFTRRVGGSWDCCNGNNTHVPMTATPATAPAKTATPTADAASMMAPASQELESPEGSPTIDGLPG